MNNKVYIVVENYASSLGDNGVNINVFKEYEKAKKHLATCVLENEDFLDCDDEMKVENINKDYYEVYEEGYFSANHYIAYIKEKGVY